MSGRELIEMIVKELARAKVPPTDAAIMQKLRDIPNLADLAKLKSQPKEGGNEEAKSSRQG